MAEVFQLGQEASKSAFVAALTTLQAQGTKVIGTLEIARLDSLVEFDRRLQAINARRIRAWRIVNQEQAVKFVVSDFTDIDQANTTGTVRADSTSVSLKERAVPAEAVIKSKVFSSNKGTVEALDAAQTILRVHTDDGTTPTGQFDIELVTALTINQLVIDIVATPSAPTILVSSSVDGLTYTSADKVAINGYRINVWLPSQEVRFIRMQIIPSHPDDLNGTSWTFGITNFGAQATEYHLRSELLTRTIRFAPKSEFVVFEATADPNIQYYLSVNASTEVSGPFVEINPGDSVHIGTLVDETITTNPSFAQGMIAVLPLTTYLNTIVVKEVIGGNKVEMRFAPGLIQTDPNRTYLLHEYVGLSKTSVGYNLMLVRADGVYTTPRTFEVSFVFGPALVDVKMKVRLSTNDKGTSPVFHGAALDEA